MGSCWHPGLRYGFLRENIARGTTDPEIDSMTCISCKFGHQMAPLKLVAQLHMRESNIYLGSTEGVYGEVQ